MWSRTLVLAVLAYPVPSHADVIYACINNSSGTIKVVAESNQCPPGSTRTSLSTAEPTPTEAYIDERGVVTMPPGTATEVARLDLPAGQYVLHGSVVAAAFANRLHCRVGSNITGVIFAEAIVFDYDSSTRNTGSVSLVGRAKLESAESLALMCTASPDSNPPQQGFVLVPKLIAHAVGTLHQQ